MPGVTGMRSALLSVPSANLTPRLPAAVMMMLRLGSVSAAAADDGMTTKPVAACVFRMAARSSADRTEGTDAAAALRP